MRYAIYRLTAPILDRIPDISHQPKGRQISIGILASIAVHVVLLLIAVFITWMLPGHTVLSFMKPKPQLQEIEITVLPVEQEVASVIPLEEAKPFISATGLAKADKAPENTTFESSQDMKAASPLPARGDAPLPTQDGRKDPNGAQFTNQQAGLDLPKPIAPPEPAAPEPPPAKAPPEEMKKVETPTENEIALQPAKEAGAGKEQAADRSLMKKMMRANLPPMPKPDAAEPTPETQVSPPPALHQQETQVDGNITNQGAKSVDAVGTPLGRYKEVVGKQVGSRWQAYTKQQGDLLQFGSARVRFYIDKRGRVKNVRLESNTANRAFGRVCEQAVLDSKFPAPSRDVVEVVPNGEIEVSFRFTLY